MAKINGSIISEYEIKKIKNLDFISKNLQRKNSCLLYTSPSPRD